MSRLASVALLSALLLPAAAAGQTVYSASAFYQRGLDKHAGFGGEFGIGAPWAQARISLMTGTNGAHLRFWNSTAWITFSPLNVHPALWSITPYDADPYLLAGVAGLFREVPGLRDWTMTPSWHWGAGVRVPLFGSPFAGYAEAIKAYDAWGFRAGLRVAFGGREVPVPVRAPTGEVSRPRRTRVSGRAGDILEEAERHLGVTYVWGGESPEYGFDCSGLVQYVYGKVGITLPRVTRDQAKVGRSLSLDIDAFEAGDPVLRDRRGPDRPRGDLRR